jgi:hypothetical protein
MVTTGVFLVVETPGQTLSTLGWVWPPVMAATAVYCMRRMRRDLQGSGRWLLYSVITSMLVASVGGLYLQVSRLGDNLPVPGSCTQSRATRCTLTVVAPAAPPL